MNGILCIFFVTLIIINIILFIDNFIYENHKWCWINIIATFFCAIAILVNAISANNQIKQIGTWIEDKQIINYEDRMIYLFDEGCVNIPWYVNVNENYYPGDDYKVLADTSNGITVYIPLEEDKTIYTSK